VLLEQLQSNIQGGVKAAGERDLAHIIDTSDMASDSAEGDLAFRIAESEGANATEVQKAIEKIDTGSYGICERCVKPIGMERIHALPFATHCIKCQELAEIRRKDDDGDELDDLADAIDDAQEEA
jgi:RNA polymerase-binding protein DksA